MTRHLITSALPYINGVKHLGNLIGSMLPADIYARYLRLQGEEVLFICATDEHGTPAELAAKEAGLEVAEYCRIQHEVQRDVGRAVRPELGPLRAQLVAGEPRAHPALRGPARGGGLPRGAHHQAGVLTGRRALPPRPLHRRHLPLLRLPERPRRPVRELHPRARPHRPHRPPVGHLRAAPTSRCARPSTSTSCSRSWPTRWRRGSRSTRTSGRRSPCRSPASGSPRASRTAGSPATSTGACP